MLLIILVIAIVFVLCVTMYFHNQLEKLKHREMLYKRIKTINYKIPLVIHQSWTNWESIDERIKEIIQQNRNICNDWDYKFYSDEDQMEYIKKNFDPKVLKAFLKINPKNGAMRTDLWRYCVMYNEGGLYLDIKSKIHTNPTSLMEPADECILFACDDGRFCGERDRQNKPFFSYEQWCLLYAPNHPYMKAAVETCVNNIEKNWIPPFKNKKKQVLYVTGPDAYSLAIHKVDGHTDLTKIKRKSFFTSQLFKYSVVNHTKVLYKDINRHYSNPDEPLYIEEDG